MLVSQIYNKILFGHKKEWNLTICDYINGPRGYNAKRNKSDKDNYHMISLVCGKTKWTNKTETESQMQKTNWWLPEGRRPGGLGKKVKGLRNVDWKLLNSHGL